MDKKGNIGFLIAGIICLIFAAGMIGQEVRDVACREIGYDSWEMAEVTIVNDDGVGLTTNENICTEDDDYGIVEIKCDFLYFNCKAIER